MRITTKGRYALRAVLNLATSSSSRQNQPISIRQIAAAEQISPEFLERIFFKLKKAKIIDSFRGPGGGFVLHKALEEISVKDIFDAVGETLETAPCVGCENRDEESCPRMQRCTAYPVWKETANRIQDYFSSLTLQNIVATYNLALSNN